MHAIADYTNERQRYREFLQDTGSSTNVVDEAARRRVDASKAVPHQAFYPNAITVGVVAPTNITGRSRLFALAKRAHARVYAGGGSAESLSTVPDVSAFSELDVLRSDDSAIQSALTCLKHASAIRYKDRLASRLEQLLEAYKEDTGGHVFSSDSLRGLLQFLEVAPSLRYPSVTITRTGDIYASWKNGPDYLFSAQFLRSKQVRFVIFRPNGRNVGQSDQLSGLTTPHSLPAMISAFGVQDWASE